MPSIWLISDRMDMPIRFRKTQTFMNDMLIWFLWYIHRFYYLFYFGNITINSHTTHPFYTTSELVRRAVLRSLRRWLSAPLLFYYMVYIIYVSMYKYIYYLLFNLFIHCNSLACTLLPNLSLPILGLSFKLIICDH